ncbi:MAG: DUF1963 domain-containing protein, partial [Odoribacteraceae bacterium]|nr:DUF1963 domain-containing protein [Odoribacteraceae bacterium]
MGLFNPFKSRPPRQEESVADRVIALFKERAAAESVRLIPTSEPCALADSKLGGVPYLPPGFPYPLERGEGRETIPLRFLAQLNLAETPPLEGFPDRGILQFYVGNDEHFGVDHETLTAQKAFRVIYHEEVIPLDAPPEIPPVPDDLPLVPLPFADSLRLRFEKETSVMETGDFRFDALLLQFYNEVARENVRALDRLPEKVVNAVYEKFTSGGHRVGGYPSFSRLDPREYHESLREHSILLLQLDTVATAPSP